MDIPYICMVLTINMSILSEILSSKVRAEVFRLLFGLNDNALHVREIERRSGFTIGTIQTEMKKLYRLDLVSKRRDGNRLYYSANQQHPVFSEIQALVVKTVGLLDLLKGALDHQKEIRVAFVFGSLAGGSEKAESDIDLMVIGYLGLNAKLQKIYEVCTTQNNYKYPQYSTNSISIFYSIPLQRFQLILTNNLSLSQGQNITLE